MRTCAVTALGRSPQETQGRTRAIHVRNHSTGIWFPSRVQTPGQVRRARSLVPLVSLPETQPRDPKPLRKSSSKKDGPPRPGCAPRVAPGTHGARSRPALPGGTLAECFRAGGSPFRCGRGSRGSPGRDGGQEVAESPAPGNSPPLPVGARPGLRAVSQLQPSPLL